MWAGSEEAVWSVSCLLGGWAPLGAAVVLRYVQAEGHRESSPAAAWVVRALGMHCVLMWLVGMSDYLRGPPGTAPQWNADQGMPLVFLALVPLLALSFTMLRWARGLAVRLAAIPPVPVAAMSPSVANALPYRREFVPPPPGARARRHWLGAVVYPGLGAMILAAGAAIVHLANAPSYALDAAMCWPPLALTAMLAWLAALELVGTLLVRRRNLRA